MFKLNRGDAVHLLHVRENAVKQPFNVDPHLEAVDRPKLPVVTRKNYMPIRLQKQKVGRSRSNLNLLRLVDHQQIKPFGSRLAIHGGVSQPAVQVIAKCPPR